MTLRNVLLMIAGLILLSLFPPAYAISMSIVAIIGYKHHSGVTKKQLACALFSNGMCLLVPGLSIILALINVVYLIRMYEAMDEGELIRRSWNQAWVYTYAHRAAQQHVVKCIPHTVTKEN